MARFHFMTSDASTGAQTDSCDLPDVGSARHMAVLFAGEMLREIDRHIFERELRIVITDDDGLLCWDLTINGVEGPGAKRR